MSPRTIAIPRVLHVSSGCLSDLAGLLEEADFDVDRVYVGSGGEASKAHVDSVLEGMRAAGIEAVSVSGLTGSLKQAAQLAARVIEHGGTLLVGVGGGRVIDTVKLAAARTNTDFVSVPTTIAHDGISSPVASLTAHDGGRQSYGAAMPDAIIVDVDVIGSAPQRMMLAGVGDLMSNLTAVLDWKRADELGTAQFDAFSAMIAENAAWPAVGIEDATTPDAHELLAKGLLMSGLAMAAAGTSRPCSGAEHLVSHSLDRLLGERAALHGEQVALGCLIAATAHRSYLAATFSTVFARLGLAGSPGDLGITEEEMVEAVRAAPGTRPDRWTILSTMADEPQAIPELVERAFAGAVSA